MTETVEILMILGTSYQDISGQPGYATVIFRNDELKFIKPDGSIHKLGPTTWSEMTGKPPLPILDSEGKLAPHYLPSLHVSNTFQVDSEEALVTLAADRGDLAVNAASQKAWILVGDAAVAADWVELQYFPVASVAGKTGNVTLAVTDIEGLPEQIANLLSILSGIVGLPSQSGNNGLYLKTNGITALWAPAPSSADQSIEFYDNGNSQNVDWNNGNLQKIAATGNLALTFSNPTPARPLRLVIFAGAADIVISFPATSSHGVVYQAPSIMVAAGRYMIFEALYFEGKYHWGIMPEGWYLA